MKTYACILALLMLAAPSAPAAEESPLVFAHSGQKVAVAIRGDRGKAAGRVALGAYGRRWGEPATVDHGTAEFVAPAVRVPVVFAIVSAAEGKVLGGELVVYPDRPVSWEKHVQLFSAGGPDWFDTWSAAVGLPVRQLTDRGASQSGAWSVSEESALLIVGPRAAGRSPAALGRLAVDKKINVLVLGASWFLVSEAPRPSSVVAAKYLAGALADWQGQQWALPPVFRGHGDVFWPAVCNRQTWIAGKELPLVEEIRRWPKGAESLRMVLSYLPWQEQLGRCEMADVLLLRLLSEAARGAKQRPPWNGRWRLLYPPAKDIKAGVQPVLAAALNAEAGSEEDAAPAEEAVPGEIRGYVIDLRGKTAPPQDLFEHSGMKIIEDRIGGGVPLLILGDNRILDTWKWLKLDRRRHRSPRPGVLWWPDRSLPSSVKDQLRLMQLFTEWNVSLAGKSPGGK